MLVIIADAEGYKSCCVILRDRGAPVFFSFYMCVCDRCDPLKHRAQGRDLSCLVLRVVLCFQKSLADFFLKSY